MKKQRTVSDEAIRGKIAQALNNAMERQGKNAEEEAASLLQVEVGTMYSYSRRDDNSWGTRALEGLPRTGADS